MSVLDKDRLPIRGLTKGDFAVFENGVPQEVSIFEAIDVPGAEPPLVAWMRDVTPDTTTNDTKVSRLWIVAVDDATIPAKPYPIQMAKQHVVSVIDRFGPEDLVTIVFTADSRPAQDFTNDRTRLLKTIERLNPGWIMAGTPPEAIIQFEMGNLHTLRNAIDALSSVPQKRKGLVWISLGPEMPTGFAVEPNMAPQVKGLGPTMSGKIAIMDKINLSKEIFEYARRANLPVYPVPPGDNSFYPGDTLRTFGDQTGGYAYMDSEERGSVIDRIFAENSSYYLMGYYPTNAKADGTIRLIDVKVNREDAVVRTRDRYFAPKPGDKPVTGLTAQLRKATAEPIPVQDLGLRGTAAAFATPGKDRAQVAIALTVTQPPDAAGGPGRVPVTTTMRVTAYTTEGTNRASEQTTSTVTLRGGTRGDTSYDALSRVELPPGRFRLRIAAQHDETSKIGTVMVDVIVPDFAGELASMSGVVIGLVPDRPSAPRDLLQRVVPVLPTAHRDFRRSDVVTALLHLYQKNPKTLAPADLRIRIRDVKDVTVIDEAQSIDIARFTVAGPPAGAEIRYRLPLERLQPGPHLLTFEARIGEMVLRRDVQFSVK